MLSMFKVNFSLNYRAAGTGKRCIDRSGSRRNCPPDDRQVLSVDFMTDCHEGEDTGTDKMLGDYSQPWSITVKSVGTAENKWLSLFFIIIHKCICKWIFIVIQRRMNRHSCRFIYNKQIIILINDIQRQLNRWDMFGVFRFLNMDRQSIAAGKCTSHIRPDSVDQNTFRHFLKLSQILIGIAFMTEILFYT